MKVIHLIDSGGFYGAEAIVVSLMEEQIQIGIEPVLCSIREPLSSTADIESSAHERGLEVKVFYMRRGLNVIGILQILEYAHSNNISIIHSHGYKTNILLGLIPRWYKRIPSICTMHGWTSTKIFAKKYLYELIEGVFVSLFDAVVFVNKKMINDKRMFLLRKSKTEKHVIYNGINVVLVINEIKSKYKGIIEKKSENAFIICSIGRLSPEKRTHDLIQAIKILSDKEYELFLVIIGDGELYDDLVNYADTLNVSGKVLFTGYQKHAYKYMGLCNAFVICSSTEGLPITLLEAIRAQIPVVATKVGGIPEIIEHEKHGLLTEPGDIYGLSMAIEKLINSPNICKNLAANAHERLLSGLTSQNMAVQYESIYKRIITKAS